MLGRLFKQQSTPTLNSHNLPNGGPNVNHTQTHNHINNPNVPYHVSNSNSYNNHNQNHNNSSNNHSNGSNIITPNNYSNGASNTSIHATATGAPSLIPNSYDDSYMREILYGTSDPLKPYPYNAKLYRIVVSQDGGSLKSKQVLFDSAASGLDPHLPKVAHPMIRRDSGNAKPIHQKLYHISQLNDYMFGCGIPTNESQSSTKLHILSNPGGAANTTTMVLVSRLFSISDELPTITNSPDWDPAAALPIKEASIPRKLHSRFSIGLVIPVENDQISDTIFQNWNEISHYLIILQKVITKKLIHILETTPNSSNCSSVTGSTPLTYSSSIWTCPYISNKRIQFPSHILQSELDLNNQVFKLIKVMNYNANIPRLINLNQMMLNNPSNPIVYNWISEILNWSEFKDGNISFLASLFSIVLTMRSGLKRRPLDSITEADKKSRDISRIVIMTGNPMVAKKLIFIINGLIPNVEVNQVDPKTLAENAVKETNEADEEIRRVGCISPQPAMPLVSLGKPVVDVDDTSDSGDETDQFAFDPPRGIGRDGRRGPGSPLSLTTSPKPIPIRQGSVNSGSVGSPDSIKGWEIPSSYNGSTIGRPRIETDTKVIPIVQQAPVHRNSLSKSASMAYLSSSLNSSLSSSISNYSLTKLSGSFLEKWKNFGTGSGSAYGSTNGSSYGAGSYGNGFGAATVGSSGGASSGVGSFNEPNINKRGSIASLRSPPSPGIDSEEYFNTYGKITNPSISAHKNLSRTQSMFDINEGLTSSVPPALQHQVVRTRTSVLVKEGPSSSSIDAKDTSFNEDAIKARCLAIMKASPIYTRDSVNSNTLTVDVNQDRASLIYKKGLLPNVAFSDEFRHEFLVQSCPINPKLESLVMNAMKNDLLFFQNNCRVEHVNSKVLFISLRAREIKLIEMSNGESGHATADHDNSNKGNNYKTTIRKIFTPQKNCGNKERIASIEEKFRELSAAFGCSNESERDHEKLSNIVVDLIK